MTLLNGKLEHLSAAVTSGRMGTLTGLSADDIAARIERLFLNDEYRGAEQRPERDK